MQMYKRVWVVSAVFWMSLVLVNSGLGQDSWAKFQNGGNLANSQWQLATEWSPDKGIDWEIGLAGYGQSSPIVAGDSIYVTSVSGANKEKLFVQAIDLKSGEEKWSYEAKNSKPEKNTPMVSRAAPSPVADEAGVVAFFEGGNLIALDPKGGLRWERDLIQEFGPITARHGLAASLEQDGSKVFVWVERDDEPYVLAISKSDGETAWKSAGLGTTTWGSPRLVPVEGGVQLVLSGVGALAGLDPATGERLWDFKDIAGNSSSTPIPLGEGRFLIGSSGGSTDGETVLSNGVIQIEKSDSGYQASWVWRAKKATCSFGSPFVSGGRAYFVNRSGILHCLDLETGDPVFVARTPSSIWATPLATGESLYFFGKDGVTTVVKPGKEFEVVSENSLWEPAPKTEEGAEVEAGETAVETAGPAKGTVLYAAAVAESTLILRRGDRLFAIGGDAER